MKYDPLHFPYPSRRNIVYGKKGMVATSQYLAAQAGLDILKSGGNAIDAAIATAACLTVVEPNVNGIGGDLFALVWTKGKLHGLNASGPAPKDLSVQKVKELGYEEMPKYGWIPVTVPGVPAGWAELSEKFGNLPLNEVLAPAVQYAREGYAVSPITSQGWQRAYEIFKEQLKGEEFKHWFETFAPKNRAPKPGEVWSSEDHARTLELIGETKAESFYKGELAKAIVNFSNEHGGYLSKEDLEEYKAEWVEPIKVNYRGYDVWEIPPNGQGIIALMALNIAKGFDYYGKDCVDTYHKQIESMKLAFADGRKYIADSNAMNVKVEELLSENYGSMRRNLIEEKAIMPEPGKPPAGGTVYLATADGEGNMVSLIQSNYMGFGSGLVVPNTGIALLNRGHGFSLDEEHCNCLAGGKKPYHTIIPGFLTKDNQPIGPFGVMGGFMQPQGHVQVIMNTIDFNLNPQQALDAPRWQWIEGKRVEVEPHFPNHIVNQLIRKGHEVSVQLNPGGFGRGQIIWRTEEGTLCGGTEPRADGAVVAW